MQDNKRSFKRLNIPTKNIDEKSRSTADFPRLGHSTYDPKKLAASLKIIQKTSFFAFSSEINAPWRPLLTGFLHI